MKLPTVYPCANMTNLEWMAGQVAAGALSSHYGEADGVVNKELVSRWIVEMAQEILAEVQRVERELPDLGD